MIRSAWAVPINPSTTAAPRSVAPIRWFRIVVIPPPGHVRHRTEMYSTYIAQSTVPPGLRRISWNLIYTSTASERTRQIWDL